MLSNQNKALFIILIYQNKVLCIKIKESSENSVKACFRDSCKDSILSNIKPIKKKFSTNIDGVMKEQSLDNEVCQFINFKVIIKNSP